MFKELNVLRLKTAMSRPGSFDDLGEFNSPSDDVIKAYQANDIDLLDNLYSPFPTRVARAGLFSPINLPRPASQHELKLINARWKALSPLIDENRSQSTIELDNAFGR